MPDLTPTSLLPVILSGGSGTRLWPLSRKLYPKQFLSLYSDKTLLQQTVRRAELLVASASPLIVCNHEHKFIVADQLASIGVKPAAIILEPSAKNTAPAVILAALHPEAEGRVLLVMPSDHIIHDSQEFCRAVTVGRSLAEQGYIVTFGITPDSPDTSFGYIKANTDFFQPDSFMVESFVEKPDYETAKSYLQKSNYFWNSGIFIFKADVILNEFSLLQPDMLSACTQAIACASDDIGFTMPNSAAWNDCASDSFDYAIMEKTTKAVVVPMNPKWSDIGNWAALWSTLQKDSDGNVKIGDVVLQDTKNSFVRTNNQLIAVVGLDDVVIIQTDDTILVASMEASKNIKSIVSYLEHNHRQEIKHHRKVHRPWGYFDSIDYGARDKVKRIVVKPGAALSLQLHHHRAEHWVVVSGVARVTKGEEVFILNENESTFIPIGVKHRLENTGELPLEIIEVQTGAYLEEDDIVRFMDGYGRA